MLDACVDLRMLVYPLFAEYPKKVVTSKGVLFQGHIIRFELPWIQHCKLENLLALVTSSLVM
jgi:hypothetical protein